MSSGNRRWEKSAAKNNSNSGGGVSSVHAATNVVSTTTTSTPSPSAGSRITAYLDGLTNDERSSHRAAFVHLMHSMTGTSVTVDQNSKDKDKRKLSGVLHTSTFFPGRVPVVILKACRAVNTEQTSVALSTQILQFASCTALTSSKLDLAPRSYSHEFQTDASIKKYGDMTHLDGRQLQSIDSSWLDPGTSASLDSKGKGVSDWDQFETNKRLFNVRSSFNEDLYTKKLDLASTTKEQIARADRIAKEIEGSSSSNIHLQEERGQIMQTDVDEEDRYSGVIREPSPASKKTTPSNSSSKSSGAWKRAAPPAAAASSSIAASPVTAPAAATAPEPAAIPTTGVPPKQSSIAAPPAVVQLLPTPPGIFSSPTSSLDTWDPLMMMQKTIPHLPISDVPSVPISTFQGGADRVDIVAPLLGSDSGAASNAATAVSTVMEASFGSLPPDELQFRPQTDVGDTATDGMSTSGFPQGNTTIGTESRPQPAPTKALNPSAKEWKPNVNALAFVPKQADPPQHIPVSPQMPQMMFSHTTPLQQQHQQGFVPDMMHIPVFSDRDQSPQGPMLFDPGMPVTPFPPPFMPPPYYAGEYMMAPPDGQPYMMPLGGMPIPLDGMPQMLQTDYFMPNYPGPHMMAPPQQNYPVPPNQMPMGNYPQYTQYPPTGSNNSNNNIQRQMNSGGRGGSGGGRRSGGDSRGGAYNNYSYKGGQQHQAAARGSNPSASAVVRIDSLPMIDGSDPATQ